MAVNGSVRPGPKLGTFYFVMDLGTDPATGKRRQIKRRGFTSERKALEAMWATQERLTLEQGVAAVSRQKLAGFCDQWVADHRTSLSAADWTNYRLCLCLHVTPHLGGIVLSDLRPSHLTRLYVTLQDGGGKDGRALSVTTVRLVHRILFGVLRDAVDHGLILANPASKAKVPKPVHAVTEVWDESETQAFLEATAGDRLGPAWALGLTCGLRRGELAGLRWRDLDLNRGMLAVEQQRTTDGDGRLVTKEPKGKSRRTVALGGRVVESLRALRERTAREREALGLAWDDAACVFTHPDASPLFLARFTTEFQRAARRAGLRRIRLHDLRHTAATLMIARGVHAKVVQERLGHYSAEFTMDRCSHVLENMQRGAADQMDNLLADRPVAF